MAAEMLEKILDAENNVKVKRAEAETMAENIISDAETKAKELIKAEIGLAENKGKQLLAECEKNKDAVLDKKQEEAKLFCKELIDKCDKKTDECVKLVFSRIFA